MSRTRAYRRIMVLSATIVAGGTVLQTGPCINTLLSITPCGTVVPLTICTPVDQLNLVFPYLRIPDFRADPSCTIPRGCGDGGVLPPIEGGPGGDDPDDPRGSEGGGAGGGGGGGGGGGVGS